MAGEMTESDVTPEAYPEMFQLADDLRKILKVNVQPRPFDQYQGPYLAVGIDMRAGHGTYAPLISLPGVVRIWYGSVPMTWTLEANGTAASVTENMTTESLFRELKSMQRQDKPARADPRCSAHYPEAAGKGSKSRHASPAQIERDRR